MIKYLIMDVDGSLTDGKVYMGNDGESMKAFSIKDGYSTNFILKPAGIESVIITGRKSKIVENRCKELGITKIYQGVIDKFPKLKEAIGDDGLNMCAYFGDDILDLRCIKPIKAADGVIGCPADAVSEVKAVADYICINKAGEGALREFTEWLVTCKFDNKKLSEKIKFAIEYIDNLDKTNIEIGIHQVNDDFYYSVQEYITQEESKCILESHRKYVDIQWILDGEEAFNITDIAGLQCIIAYSDEKDIIFWKPIQNMMRMVLKAASYAVLYPKNAHMGGIAVSKPVKVKKIVGKVRI